VAEKATHKRTVTREGGRLHAATQRRAIEVETSGSPTRLRHAAEKLKRSGKSTRVLVVPHRDMTKAADAMQRVGTTGAVRNLSGTTTRRVVQAKAALTAKGKMRASASKERRGR
jgi:DNA-binding transcriptional regulator LsrR (DeoR family)